MYEGEGWQVKICPINKEEILISTKINTFVSDTNFLLKHVILKYLTSISGRNFIQFIGEFVGCFQHVSICVKDLELSF